MEQATRAGLPRLGVFALLAFVILASYEIARPASESLFLAAHGAEALPRVWLLVAVGATVIVSIYNLFSARVPLTRLMALCAALAAGTLIGLKAAVAARMPGAEYLLYLWKDVYIVLLIELFWTIANATLPLSSAKWAYGLLCAAGTLGSITGARLLQYAVKGLGMQTTDALLWVLPFFALVAALALSLERFGAVEAKAKAKQGFGELLEGLRIFKESRYLSYLLVLILIIQIVVTLVDYQFNVIIEAEFPEKAAKTIAMAQVYERISYGALAMQILTGVFIGVLGVRGSMLFIPGVIFVSAAAMILHPRYLAAATAKIVGKVMDYSLFRTTKELLYLPLSYREKTQGKALIDMLTYRLAKGGVALILQALLALGLAAYIGWITLSWVSLWLMIAVIVVRRYRALVS